MSCRQLLLDEFTHSDNAGRFLNFGILACYDGRTLTSSCTHGSLLPLVEVPYLEKALNCSRASNEADPPVPEELCCCHEIIGFQIHETSTPPVSNSSKCSNTISLPSSVATTRQPNGIRSGICRGRRTEIGLVGAVGRMKRETDRCRGDEIV